MIGDPSLIKYAEIKKFVEDESIAQQQGVDAKEVKKPKFIEKDTVSFKFKEKGKAAVNAKGVLQFTCTGV